MAQHCNQRGVPDVRDEGEWGSGDWRCWAIERLRPRLEDAESEHRARSGASVVPDASVRRWTLNKIKLHLEIGSEALKHPLAPLPTPPSAEKDLGATSMLHSSVRATSSCEAPHLELLVLLMEFAGTPGGIRTPDPQVRSLVQGVSTGVHQRPRASKRQCFRRFRNST